MELTPSTRRILKVYRKATPEQIADGMAWYDEAHALAVELDPQNVLRAAGVIAAYSPLTEWEENAELARSAYKGVFRGHPMTSKVKAILAGADVLPELNGSKISNFARLIYDPADPEAVAVDRHAFAVAVGRVTTDKERAILRSRRVYQSFADAYRRAAKIEGVTPSQMQAVTWVAWRETVIRTQAAMRLKAGRAA